MAASPPISRLRARKCDRASAIIIPPHVTQKIMAPHLNNVA